MESKVIKILLIIPMSILFYFIGVHFFLSERAASHVRDKKLNIELRLGEQFHEIDEIEIRTCHQKHRFHKNDLVNGIIDTVLVPQDEKNCLINVKYFWKDTLRQIGIQSIRKNHFSGVNSFSLFKDSIRYQHIEH